MKVKVVVRLTVVLLCSLVLLGGALAVLGSAGSVSAQGSTSPCGDALDTVEGLNVLTLTVDPEGVTGEGTVGERDNVLTVTFRLELTPEPWVPDLVTDNETVVPCPTTSQEACDTFGGEPELWTVVAGDGCGWKFDNVVGGTAYTLAVHIHHSIDTPDGRFEGPVLVSAIVATIWNNRPEGPPPPTTPEPPEGQVFTVALPVVMSNYSPPLVVAVVFDASQVSCPTSPREAWLLYGSYEHLWTAVASDGCGWKFDGQGTVYTLAVHAGHHADTPEGRIDGPKLIVAAVATIWRH